METSGFQGTIPKANGGPPASIYLVNSSIEQHNLLFGAVYGSEHVAEREMDMSILMELIRRYEILYTPEGIHMAFEATVRNFIDLVVDGVRRMLRAPRQ